MKKLWKILNIIFTNILCLICVIFLIDVLIYEIKTHDKRYLISYKNKMPSFKYLTKPYVFHINTTELFINGPANKYVKTRLPDGLEYHSVPLVVFGCSYAYGDGLNYNQTFSYKLAHILKKPVYNRAISGSSMQHMFIQTTEEGFYQQVPKADTYIYVFMSDHYRRMLGLNFRLTDRYVYTKFNIENGKFVPEDYSNPIINIINSSYIVRLIKAKIVQFCLNNPSFDDYFTDLAVKYFIETRKNIINHYISEDKNYNPHFIVILYENNNIRFKKLLINKLQAENIEVIETSKLTKEDLNAPEYIFSDNLHPNEKAWALLTPLIASKIKS